MEEVKSEVFTAKVPSEAVIREYTQSVVFVMPNNCGCDLHRYMLGSKDITKNEDGSYNVRIVTPRMTVRRCGHETVYTAEEFAEKLNTATADDYKRVWYEVKVPLKKVTGAYPNMVRIKLPHMEKYTSTHVVFPCVYLTERDDDYMTFRLPDYFNVNMANGNEDYLVPAKEITEILNGTAV